MKKPVIDLINLWLKNYNFLPISSLDRKSATTSELIMIFLMYVFNDQQHNVKRIKKILQTIFNANDGENYNIFMMFIEKFFMIKFEEFFNIVIIIFNQY